MCVCIKLILKWKYFRYIEITETQDWDENEKNNMKYFNIVHI